MPEERPVVRREEKWRASHVKMARNQISFDLEQKGKKPIHVHDRVIKKRNTWVGNWRRDRPTVYVDPRLTKKEQTAVALHEGVERYEAVHRRLPKYPAHLVAEHIEERWDRGHGLGKGYQQHVEQIFRSNVESHGTRIGITGDIDRMVGRMLRKGRKR